MRSSSWVLTAACGLALIAVSIPRAEAMTTTAPSALGAGLETAGTAETVHCRNYRHRHRYGHGWGYGCKRRIIIVR